MEVKKFNKINEEVDYPEGTKVIISFSGDIEINMEDIKKMSKYVDYENKDLNNAIFLAIEEYLYDQGEMGFSWKMVDKNGDEVEDPNIFKDKYKYNL